MDRVVAVISGMVEDCEEKAVDFVICGDFNCHISGRGEGNRGTDETGRKLL